MSNPVPPEAAKQRKSTGSPWADSGFRFGRMGADGDDHDRVSAAAAYLHRQHRRPGAGRVLQGTPGAAVPAGRRTSSRWCSRRCGLARSRGPEWRPQTGVPAGRSLGADDVAQADVPMQMHLDFTVPGRDELERQRERAEALGARCCSTRTDDASEPLYALRTPQAIRSASSSPDREARRADTGSIVQHHHAVAPRSIWAQRAAPVRGSHPGCTRLPDGCRRRSRPPTPVSRRGPALTDRICGAPMPQKPTVPLGLASIPASDLGRILLDEATVRGMAPQLSTGKKPG